MAQRARSNDRRQGRAASKQQREAERKFEIEMLTLQISELRGKLTEVDEQREALELPNLKGKDVEHSHYGQGTVTEQKDAVLTIEYANGVRKQKLPFVIASGCVKIDDREATELCQKISDLETEQTRLRKEIQYRESAIADLQKKS